MLEKWYICLIIYLKILTFWKIRESLFDAKWVVIGHSRKLIPKISRFFFSSRNFLPAIVFFFTNKDDVCKKHIFILKQFFSASRNLTKTLFVAIALFTHLLGALCRERKIYFHTDAAQVSLLKSWVEFLSKWISFEQFLHLL